MSEAALHELWLRQLAKAVGPNGETDLEKLGALISATYARAEEELDRLDVDAATLEERNRRLAQDLAQSAAEMAKLRGTMATTLDNIEQGIAMLDAEGNIPIYNRRTIELLGLPPELMEQNLTSDQIVEYQLRNGEFDGASDEVKAFAKARTSYADLPRYERKRPNGTVIEVRTVSLPDGGCVRTFSDITALRAREDALRQAEAEYHSLFENAAIGIYRTTFDGKLLRANPALARLNGFETEAELLATVSDIGAEWYADPSRREAFRGLVDENGVVTEFISQVHRYKTREKIWVSETAWLVRDANGVPLFYEGAVVDVTERRRAEEHLAHLAHHDALTGVANRIAFQHALDATLLAVGEQMTALLVIDLGRFKEVNDSLGHAAGDDLLRLAARRIRRSLGSEPFVARLGGDVFAAVLRDSRTRSEVLQRCERTIDNLSRPFRIRRQRVAVRVSVGIAFAPHHGASSDELLRNANAALFAARTKGSWPYAIYNDEMSASLQQRRRLEADLRTALARGELSIAFQPIVDVVTGAIVCAEALMRWRHPEFGMVPPSEFIPIAEESGLIIPLGEWALREACAQATEHLAGVKIAVNISPMQFRSPGLVAAAIRALSQSGLPSQLLELEITESALLQDDPFTLEALTELRAIGVSLALDDFGAGHSSLSYLLKFHFDKIKIDRSFISSLGDNRGTAAIVRAVVNLASEIGVSVVAEGVETDEHLREVRLLGCRLAQGYLFSEPQAAELLLEQLGDRAIRSAAA
ncbi:EAL domain-containing protein [Terrarubrum flagellatum]|uniref:EAL domain-containing protein n=1 Tax=Terrirubrum flagellatum TaxID=2895980 RepID=UPI003144D6D6